MEFWFHGLLGLASILSILNQIAGTVRGGVFLTRSTFQPYNSVKSNATINKTKDWALVQTAAINQGFDVRLG